MQQEIISKIGSAEEYKQINELEVLDSNALNEFKYLSSLPWIDKERHYQSYTNKNIRIDLMAKENIIYKAIQSLPKDEQNEILTRRFICERFYIKLTKSKIKALTGNGRPQLKNQFVDSAIILDNRKADILALFGRMFSIEEVYKTITKDYGLDVDMYALDTFRASNIQKIIELQKAYTQNYNDIRLGYKKSRLEELTWLYQDTKQQFESKRHKDDRKFLKELLESIKKEVEGDVIRIEGDLQINIEHTLNLHVQQEIMKKMPINEAIITRVALRTGVNPLMLLYRLQNSYYSKFSGFNVAENEEQLSLPEYPSSFTYDLDKIAQNYEEIKLRDKNKNDMFEEAIIINDTQIETVSPLKKILLDKIAQKKKDLEDGINNTQI